MSQVSSAVPPGQSFVNTRALHRNVYPYIRKPRIICRFVGSPMLTFRTCKADLIRQLLYQPFTPFFILFTHTINSTDLSSFVASNNIAHLRALPRFLDAMSKFCPEAFQLKLVADVFIARAQAAAANRAMTLDARPDTVASALPSENQASSEHTTWNKSTAQRTLLPSCAEHETPQESKPLWDRVNPYFDWFSWTFSDATR